MIPTDISSIQVIDRMVALLDALAAEGGKSSLKRLAAETGLHPSTAHRILGALAGHEVVARDASGGYLLGPRLLRLSAHVRAGTDVREAARGEMIRLRDQVNETVNLTLREGDEVVYVERVSPNRMMRVEQVIGSRAPLHVTAVGKLMLGDGGAEAVREYARRAGLARFTPNTRTSQRALLGDIGTSLTRGYALDDEEAETGVGCLGTLIRDAQGQVVAGLSISAPIERRKMDWAPLLLDAARRISARLGGA